MMSVLSGDRLANGIKHSLPSEYMDTATPVFALARKECTAS